MVFSCAKWITKPGTVRRVWWNIWFCWSRPSPRIYSCSTHREGPAERCQNGRPRCFCSCVPVTDARTGSGMTCSDPWQLRVDVCVDVRAHPAGDGVSSPRGDLHGCSTGAFLQFACFIWSFWMESPGFGHICPTSYCGCDMGFSLSCLFMYPILAAWSHPEGCLSSWKENHFNSNISLVFSGCVSVF